MVKCPYCQYISHNAMMVCVCVCVRKHCLHRKVCLVFLGCTAAGVFVHCWSSLLSPICCYSLAWKQDRERFHTYTHWPLINKSDQGPFPHIHATHMKTKSTHTDTDTSQSTHFARSPPHLSSWRIRPGNPNFGLSNLAT